MRTTAQSFNAWQQTTTMVGIMAVVVAAATWGMSGIWITLVAKNSGCSAVALAFWRDFTAFSILLMYGLIAWPNKIKVRRRDIAGLVGMGMGLGVFHILYNTAVLLNGAAITTVQQAAMPAIVVVAARYLWHEKITGRKLAAIGLTAIGTLLSTGLIDGAPMAVSAAGMAAGMSVPIFYAAWNLFGKQARIHYDARVVMLYAFGIAALMLLPFQLFVQQPTVNTDALLSFAGLIGLSTLTPFLLYAFGLGRLQAGVAGILAMLEIVFAAVFARAWLHEYLSALQIGGAMLVIMGSGLLFLKGKPATSTIPRRS